MATAGAGVDRLLRRLASDARGLKLPMKIYEDVAHMTRTLSKLQDVLVSVERQYFEVRTELQNWMRKIEQTACDMEDLLDGFENHYSIGSQSTAKATSFCSSGPFFLHSTKANRMKTLRRRVDNLAKDSVIFNLMQHPRCDLEPSDNQEEFSTVAIVGRDHDKAKIENIILQSDADRLSIIPIVGLVGVGKTALARSIFCDRVEGRSLDIHIWVKLNRKLNLKKIAAEIILQANETKEVRPAEIHENFQLLKNRLQEALHEKSCLIVLDGLCSTDKSLLDELKEMLRGTNKCIKVLVTTSNEITAELMHTVPPYKLLPLSEDDCWTIFSTKAFGDGDGVNACLKEIGKQIVKRCKGIPALAQSLGSIVHNQVMNVWLAARDEAIWELEKAYSTKIEVLSPFNQIYHDMPSALKLCFLYLSIFSKGSVIDKEKLIRQWIALDMIGSKYETLPSYVHGEMYIQDLLSVHFFQVQKTHSVNGMENMIAPTTLYMHNFVHDFARHVACNDIIILDDREMGSNAKKFAFQYVLLTYYTGQSTLCSSLLTRARALHFQNSESIKLHRETFKLLKHLRVLNLGGSCIGEIPASVGHLKHLRYLDISDLKIQTLPSSMSNLTNLEALDLSNTSLKELPSFIGSLEKLKYLNLQGCDMLQNLPATLGHLQRLEHLRLSCCCDVGELADSLCNLKDLRFLDLSSCTELLELPPSFGNLMNLGDLNLSGCFNLKQLPESFGNLYFLRLLNISSCYELQQLPVSLCNLVKLEVLILRRCRRLQNLSPSFGNFPNLRILDLAGCKALHVSTGMLATNLEYLNLQQCLKLQTQPNHFSNFTKLKFLNLSQCMPAVDCLQSLDYLFNLEYLNLSHNQLGVPVSLVRLQKLHTLDLTGCVLEQQSHIVTRVILDICKMTRLEVLLTKDPMIVASLPPYIRYSVSIDDQWHMSTDELIISDLARGPSGLNIAERTNLQNRPELRSVTLEWAYTSHPAARGVVEDLGEDVLEKLQPHRNLEHFELVGYLGFVCPTWMMDNMVTLLPNLVSLHLFNLGNCKNLPPLGQLLNLRHLHIKEMPNLVNLEMGLSGVVQSFKKLTHLKLESLLNLEELPILLSTNNDNQQFMFPALEELSVLSCPKLIFKPSLPKCAKYEIKDSNRILSCGAPLGPLSSPSPADILITGCRVTSSSLQWLNSMQSLEKVVISACVRDDGEAVTSFKLLRIKDTQESSGSKIPNENTNQSSPGTNVSHELTTQDTASKNAVGVVERMNLQNRPELRSLTLEWAYTPHPAARGVVEDLGEEVLEKLQPHWNLEHFELVGYLGFVCPTWMMKDMVTLLPNLVSLHLFNFGNCKNLPPLGQLLNLRHLQIKEMPNLVNLEMGLSGVAQSFKKLTHLKLESLLNLEELPILLSTNNDNQQFMFPALEELSVLSCPKLIFKPSLPKCAKYEIKDSNRILSCGEPLGPLSSPSPADILITGCRVTSSSLQWLNSMQSLEKVVISACVRDDGEAVPYFKLLRIKDTQESSGSKIPNENTNQSSPGTNVSHELTTQDSSSKNAVGVVDLYRVQQSSDESPLQSLQQNSATTRPSTSIIRKLSSIFNITSGHSETPPTSHRLSTSKLSGPIPGVRSLNLSLRQVQKATRKFSPSLKLGEDQLWTVYKAILVDNQFVVVRRANKGCVQDARNRTKVQLLAAINHWSLVRFLGFIDKGNEFIMISEYVPNGTLRQHLHGQHIKTLDINQRIVIAIDVAIALTYLHLSTGETIIHSDLKTSKILLTETYRVKVDSSELSIGGTIDQLRGTLGYMDPEMVQNFELTAKSNVYSFGIILLEIISSHAPYKRFYDKIGDFNDQPYGSNMDLVGWVLKKFEAGHMEEILDDRLEDHVDEIFLRDWFSLVSWCTDPKGDVRPRIEEVGSRLWKIWKDHRERIGEPYEYERSWEEFANLVHEGTGYMEFPGKGEATEPQDWPDASDQQLGSTQQSYYYGSPIRSDILSPPVSSLSSVGSRSSHLISPRLVMGQK